jgi:hypothetical protein
MRIYRCNKFHKKRQGRERYESGARALSRLPPSLPPPRTPPAAPFPLAATLTRRAYFLGSPRTPDTRKWRCVRRASAGGREGGRGEAAAFGSGREGRAKSFAVVPGVYVAHVLHVVNVGFVFASCTPARRRRRGVTFPAVRARP